MNIIFQSVNPRTEEILTSFETLPSDDLEAKISHADNAQRQWHSLSIQERASVIRRVGELLKDNIERYSTLLTMEMGKPLNEAVAEIKKCAHLCFYSADNSQEILKERKTSYPEAEVVIRHEPLGIILGIMPWNFPFWQLFRAGVPTLLCGNVMLFKHASNTPQCAIAIEEVFHRAIPSLAIMQNLFIDHEQVSAIIADSRIKGITLTGSKRAGVAVVKAAAQSVKPCVLELGGSDPFIVCADADLERAAQIAANSRCMNNGQSCIAAKRFIIEQSIFDRFAQLLTDNMALKDIGPQATKQQQETLIAQVDDAVSKGAHVHCGGDVTTPKGFFYPATVLSNIDASMRIAKEEVFGPVAALYTFSTDDEALEIANDSDFGLGATVFTKDSVRAQNFSKELACGQVFINDMVRSDPRIPFGGIKESGYGRELGERASLAFTNEKVVWFSKTAT